MSNLFVLKLENEETAKQVLGTLKQLQNQNLIKVDDAAILTRNPDGKAKIQQAHDLVGAGALGGAFWGMLIGFLFFAPFLGAAIGAGVGAFAGKFNDYGINDDFIKQVGEAIQPGDAGLFLLTQGGVVDKVLPELKSYKFQLIQTSLSKEDEAKLREALGAAA
jgi:uncharacterized membrane protein